MNSFYRAWNDTFQKLNNCDGGRGLNSILNAYGMDLRLGSSDVLNTLIVAGGNMTHENQIEKTWEAFSMGSDAVKGLYPQGDKLVEILVKSGMNPAHAYKAATKFCSSKGFQLPTEVPTQESDQVKRPSPRRKSVQSVSSTMKRVVFVCSTSDRVDFIVNFLQQQQVMMNATSFGALATPNMTYLGRMNNVEVLVTNDDGTGECLSHLQKAWKPDLYLITGTTKGCEGKCNLGDILIAEAFVDYTSQVPHTSTEQKFANRTVLSRVGAAGSLGSMISGERPKYSRRFVEQAILKVLADSNVKMSPKAVMEAVLVNHVTLTEKEFKTKWSSLRDGLIESQCLSTENKGTLLVLHEHAKQTIDEFESTLNDYPIPDVGSGPKSITGTWGVMKDDNPEIIVALGDLVERSLIGTETNGTVHALMMMNASRKTNNQPPIKVIVAKGVSELLTTPVINEGDIDMIATITMNGTGRDWFDTYALRASLAWAYTLLTNHCSTILDD